MTKVLDFRAFSLIRWPLIGIHVYYDLYISFKESAETVILKRLFTLGLGLVLRRKGGGDSVVSNLWLSHIVSFGRRDGFKSLNWQKHPHDTLGKFYHYLSPRLQPRDGSLHFRHAWRFLHPGEERKGRRLCMLDSSNTHQVFQ